MTAQLRPGHAAVTSVAPVASSGLERPQPVVIRAEEDYQRLLSAYLALARDEHSHEVALAMVGADMERAHATLQGLTTGQMSSAMLRRAGRRMAEQRR